MNDEVLVIGMVGQVGAHERADSDQSEASGADVLEGASDQERAETLALEERVDLGMHQHDDAGSELVLDEPGRCLTDQQLVALLVGVIDDSRGGVHCLTRPFVLSSMRLLVRDTRSLFVVYPPPGGRVGEGRVPRRALRRCWKDTVDTRPSETVPVAGDGNSGRGWTDPQVVRGPCARIHGCTRNVSRQRWPRIAEVGSLYRYRL